jgi:nucleotide-binding universal stress UspA family protein
MMMNIAGRLLEIATRSAWISLSCWEVDWARLGTESVSAIVSRLAATMAIVRQFPDLDPARDDAKLRPLEPAARSNVLEIGEVLREAKADLDKVAALADHIGAEDEKREFREHVAEASALYQAVADAVAQGPSP